MLSQQELQITHLQDTVKSVRDELGVSVKNVLENERKILVLKDETNRKEDAITRMESDLGDLESNLKIMSNEKDNLHKSVCSANCSLFNLNKKQKKSKSRSVIYEKKLLSGKVERICNWEKCFSKVSLPSSSGSKTIK